MKDDGAMSPGERFDRLEQGLGEFRDENRQMMSDIKDEVHKTSSDVKEALKLSRKANERIDEYEKIANKKIRRAGAGAMLLLLVFNYDKLLDWIKHAF